ncbi:hypothetical protein [Clostridium sp.]|uniref:hypothetical protein n=1 Tax=Clostridium sp. TaxID=1506 RepID=UPI001D509AF4|nr:hypothetical protein [Clostridium sp.]MBS5307733.1 hypothetical protein [Clostridium sp.]
MSNLYELYKKYEVKDVKTIEEFLKKYGKYDRYEGRGEEYFNCSIKSNEEDLNKYGYTIISHHDSVTGRVVSFYNKEDSQC